MANEWVKVELYGVNNDGRPRRYTIADGTSVSIGTVMALTDNRTVVVATTASTPLAGVASEEHEANIGVTSLSCWTDGVFRATASGALTVGDSVACGGYNLIRGAPSASSGSYICGYTFDTLADAETGSVRLLL